MFEEHADIETATADYASRFSGEAGKYFLDQQTAITLQLLKDYPKARVLDVGGGLAQLAEPLVANVVDALRATGLAVETGRFRTEMEVDLVNDGPVTLVVRIDPPASGS